MAPGGVQRYAPAELGGGTLRKRVVIAALAGSLVASPAFACVPFMFVDAVAHGKVRTARGDWAQFSMETSNSLVRIEYSSSKSPTGRFAVVGNIDRGWAYGFPVGSAQAIESAPKRTSMQRLLDQAGLPGWAFAQANYSQERTQTFRGVRCQPMDVLDTWPLRGEKGARVCVDARREGALGGQTVLARNARGERVLEVISLERRTVSLARFNPPRPQGAPLVIATRDPTSCIG